MRNYLAALVIACVIMAAVIIVLRPGPGVEFEANLSRLEPEEALRVLREAQDTTAFHDNLELIYARLLLSNGEVDEARQAFERILSKTGPSADIFDTLARLELVDSNEAAAAGYLQQAYDLSPTADRRARLGLLYRSLRMLAAELTLLQSVKPVALTDWELERLGMVLIASGQGEAYERLLFKMARLDNERGQIFRKRLLELLIESDQADIAMDQVSTWLEKDTDPGAALELAVGSLLGRGALDAAITVTRIAFATAPDESHRALPAFMKSGHGGVARILQSEWLSEATSQLNTAQWDTVLFLAVSSGDLRTLQQLLASDQVDMAPPEIVGEALLQFVRYRGPESLVPYHHLLSPQVEDAAPLVAAAWASWSGRPEAIHDFLVAAAQTPLTEWDQAIWMSISDRLRGTPFYADLLGGAVTNPDLQNRLREAVIPQRQLDAVQD